ncbi:MAG: hypothetical protein OQL19_20975 [Gammaproteobacteria bacterium]|nr:hypothetical protein [Gammaproteobacteria bacterium]
MLNLTETAIRLYRQIFGSPEFAGQLVGGIETVLDGNTAIAVTEACISEVAALGGGFLEQGAALAWLSEQERVSNNFFDEKLSVQYADSPRGALASAIGVTLSGHRSTVFLSAHDLSACHDLLQTAVGRRIPLVVHLDNRLSATQGNSQGSSHDVLHQMMDSGCFVLFASNVQEAVDFTLVARQVAELTLTPGLVVIDGMETALSAQNVHLPSAELVKQFIGRADDVIDAPSIAQRQLFSEQRKRVHRWHDLDKPVLQGAMQSSEIYSLGNAARETYFEALVSTTLENSFAQYAQLTARQYSSISTFDLKKADIIFIAQGSAIESLRTYSTYLKGLKKSPEKMNIGVIGLHSIRPFNSKQLVDILQKNKTSSQRVIILERMTVPMADDSPLLREIRAAIHKHVTQKDNDSNTIYKLSDFPELRSIIYGLGGVSLDLNDLGTLCEKLSKDSKNSSDSTLSLNAKYLGIPFISYDVSKASSKTKEQHPKRQVMLDTLERYYPQISELGINAIGDKSSLCSNATQSINFAISHMIEANETISYATDLSATLYKLKSGYLRSSISPSWEQWAKRQTDYVTHSDKPYDVGQSSLVNFFIAISADENALLKACQNLSNNGVLIFTYNNPSYGFSSDEIFNECQKIINERNIVLYKVENQQNDRQWENILATIIGLMLNNNQLNIKVRKVVSIRELLINTTEEEQKNNLIESFKETLNSILEIKDDTEEHMNSNRFKLSSSSSSSKKQQGQSEIPEMVKQLGKATESYDSLPRFWDQIGVLEQSGKSSQLTSDPYLATGTIPSLSATFNNMSRHRQALNGDEFDLPVFNPQACTACGECWANCPDSAIAVVSITPKALIETGIKMTGADAMRQVSGKLASRIAKRCRNNEVETNNAGELISDAFDWLKEKSGLPEERLMAIEMDYEKVHLAVADLPVVLSDSLFYSQEKCQNDTGELLSLIINPDSCKSCGLCIERCQSKNEISALTFADDDLNVSDYQLKQQWKIWQQTPDTSSATIERLLNEKTIDAGAALMMSRYNAFALSGGDHGELASGEKIAMRHLLSATEYHQQPLLHQFISELDKLRNEIKQEINASLSEALPTDNLAHLSEKLSDVKTRQVDLNALLEQSSQVMDTSSIDAVRTHQLVKLVLELNDLHWKLSEGSYGIGRSRYSLCITSSSIASWAGTFPYNPFHVPVNIDVTGESAQVAAGLIQGQIKDVLAAVSLLRQAKASINPRYAKETEKLDDLEWSDLNDDEKHLCPPLFLVGGDDLLGSHGFSQISLLLNSSYPIKIIVFHELDAGLVANGLQEHQLISNTNRRSDSRNHLAMLAMSQRNAYVAQTSISDNNHFQQSIHELLDNHSAGLICIHTPSPQRHGFSPEQTLNQADMAVKTGMFPLFNYNPQKEGVFGSRLSLQHSDSLQKISEYNPELNPVHWAMNEKRFQSHFSMLTDNAVFPTELSQWLNLSTVEQNKKTPFILITNLSEDLSNNEKTKISVSKAFASMIGEQQNVCRTLLELAGIETPFTDYVEQCVEERLSSEHQSDLDALRAEYEAKIAEINANYHAETHTKIRNQLLGLAGYDANNLREH